MTQQELMDQLEPLVDKCGLPDVVLALARVCNEKAEHLRHTWQDNRSARKWDTAAKRLDKLADG